MCLILLVFENFRYSLTYCESEDFLIPLLITFLTPKVLGILFCTKNSLNWAVKCAKVNFRKSYRKFYAFVFNKLRNLYMNTMIV